MIRLIPSLKSPLSQHKETNFILVRESGSLMRKVMSEKKKKRNQHYPMSQRLCLLPW